MTSIGGYFEIELDQKHEFHLDALKVNTGRNALEYILKANNYVKIYIPFYTCDVILEPIIKLNISYEFYSINSKLEPIFNFNDIGDKEAFLYTNYYGVKDNFVNELSRNCKNLIIDNAQSFFSRPIKGVDSFYSARKFFGVPNGAYLYSNNTIEGGLERDISPIQGVRHLIMRAEYGPEEGYKYFLSNEESLINNPIKKMSKLTQKILKSINYNKVINIRKMNFNYLLKNLNTDNELKFESNDIQVPMIYPFLRKNNDRLFKRLIENKVFVAKYWPNVKVWAGKDSFEYFLAENTLALPIDHRYNIEDMARIIKLITAK